MSSADREDLRFYESKFPEVDEVVMAVVTSIEDIAVYVELLEYNNAPGMILMSELHKRRFRSIQKIVKVGNHESVMVIRTDEKKGYIDLSKRRVNSEDIAACEERYSKAKAVQTIIRHIASVTGKTVLELNEKITWPLAKKYGNEHEAFRMAAIDNSIFDSLSLSDEVKDMLLTDIRLRLSPPPVKMRARCTVSCLGSDGIEGVRKALRAGRDLAFVDTTNTGVECSVEIRLVATPVFLITATATHKELGLEHVNNVIAEIKRVIEATEGGRFNIEEEAHIVGLEEKQEEDEDEEDDSDEDGSSDEEDEGMGRVEDDE
eukprot:GDKJ01029946.1.p1 GENE.GDKJ01029946.1~~GDKJ01029946.1.p1  ORF type:complete len:326 (-),score=105.19 GDKJ01029946.1:133-1086(-)